MILAKLFNLTKPKFLLLPRWSYIAFRILWKVNWVMYIKAPHICVLFIGKLAILSRNNIYFSLVICLMRNSVVYGSKRNMVPNAGACMLSVMSRSAHPVLSNYRFSRCTPPFWIITSFMQTYLLSICYALRQS